MRTTIQRRIATTTIHPVKVTFENGVPSTEPLETITAYGEITPDKAKKIVDKKYGKGGNVVVAKTETANTLYEISVEDFVAHATPVDEKTETETEPETETV